MSVMRLSRPRKTEVIEMERKGRGRRPVEEITDMQRSTLKEIRLFMNRKRPSSRRFKNPTSLN